MGGHGLMLDRQGRTAAFQDGFENRPRGDGIADTDDALMMRRAFQNKGGRWQSMVGVHNRVGSNEGFRPGKSMLQLHAAGANFAHN